jgi:hypothetical protein
MVWFPEPSCCVRCKKYLVRSYSGRRQRQEPAASTPRPKAMLSNSAVVATIWSPLIRKAHEQVLL